MTGHGSIGQGTAGQSNVGSSSTSLLGRTSLTVPGFNSAGSSGTPGLRTPPFGAGSSVTDHQLSGKKKNKHDIYFLCCKICFGSITLLMLLFLVFFPLPSTNQPTLARASTLHENRLKEPKTSAKIKLIYGLAVYLIAYTPVLLKSPVWLVRRRWLLFYSRESYSAGFKTNNRLIL